MIALIGSQASGLRSPGKILRPARLDTWLLLNDLHQVRYFGHHAASRGRVRPLDYLVKPRKTQSLDYLFLFGRRANRGTHVLQLNLAATRSVRRLPHHGYNSSTALPRSLATSSLFFNLFSASKVALITLCGFVVPIVLVSTFCIPATLIRA